jgi:hypothetical protein
MIADVGWEGFQPSCPSQVGVCARARRRLDRIRWGWRHHRQPDGKRPSLDHRCTGLLGKMYNVDELTSDLSGRRLLRRFRGCARRRAKNSVARQRRFARRGSMPKASRRELTAYSCSSPAVIRAISKSPTIPTALASSRPCRLAAIWLCSWSADAARCAFV